MSDTSTKSHLQCLKGRLVMFIWEKQKQKFYSLIEGALCSEEHANIY